MKKNINTIKKLLLLSLIFALSIGVYGQSEESGYTPTWVIKTNALYWATTTPNIGVEVGLSDKFTLDVSGNYNPWVFGGNKKFKHFLVQPELRYWKHGRFNGHFFGLHTHYVEYNVAIKMLGFQDYRYEGYLVGAGLSYGYRWELDDRWSIEATIGAGYAYMDYTKYRCEECGEKIKDDTKHYWGPTKVGVNVVYILK